MSARPWHRSQGWHRYRVCWMIPRGCMSVRASRPSQIRCEGKGHSRLPKPTLPFQNMRGFLRSFLRRMSEKNNCQKGKGSGQMSWRHGGTCPFFTACVNGLRVIVRVLRARRYGPVSRQEPSSPQLHVVLGSALAVIYPYVTKTCDQRQSVVVESDDAGVLPRRAC